MVYARGGVSGGKTHGRRRSHGRVVEEGKMGKKTGAGLEISKEEVLSELERDVGKLMRTWKRLKEFDGDEGVDVENISIDVGDMTVFLGIKKKKPKRVLTSSSSSSISSSSSMSEKKSTTTTSSPCASSFKTKPSPQLVVKKYYENLQANAVVPVDGGVIVSSKKGISVLLPDKKPTLLIKSLRSEYAGMSYLSRHGKESNDGKSLDVLMCDVKQHQIKLLRLLPKDLEMRVLCGSLRGFQDGKLSMAKFNQPTGICVCDDDDGGNGAIIVADRGNHAIRKIENNMVSTICGGVKTSNGRIEAGYVDGEAKPLFNQPIDVVYHDRKIYVCDRGNNCVRIVETNNEPPRVQTLCGGLDDPTSVEIDVENRILFVTDRRGLHQIHLNNTTSRPLKTKIILHEGLGIGARDLCLCNDLLFIANSSNISYVQLKAKTTKKIANKKTRGRPIPKYLRHRASGNEENLNTNQSSLPSPPPPPPPPYDDDTTDGSLSPAILQNHPYFCK